MKRAFPIFAAITGLLLIFSTYQALVVAPTERTMGDVQRIFYYHVPSAWTSFLLFFVNLCASVQYLVHVKPAARRAANLAFIAIGIGGAVAPFLPQVAAQLPEGTHPSSIATMALAIPILYFLVGRYFPESSADALAVSAAETGVVFCTIVLITGPLWARPVWGIWWTWDMRLTSTLVLWLIYVSYLLLRRFSDSAQTPVLAAVLAIFGALDVPLVYFSIWFFRTQHPQPVMGAGGSLDPRMLHVFLLNLAVFTLFGALLCWARFRIEMMQRQLEETRVLEALLDDGRTGSSPARSSR